MRNLARLRERPETAERARALVTTVSYREARAAAQGLADAIGRRDEVQRRLCTLTRDGDGFSRTPTLTRRTLHRFAATGADVLIAPLSVVARGHNILQAGRDLSALHSVFMLVRPVPQVAAPAEMLAFVGYRSARRANAEPDIDKALAAAQRHARGLLRRWHSAVGPFSRLPPEILHALFYTVLVDLAQLAGRARRGDTPASVYLVDGAFEHETAGWPRLVENSLRFWRREGDLPTMQRLHAALMQALDDFAPYGDDR